MLFTCLCPHQLPILISLSLSKTNLPLLEVLFLLFCLCQTFEYILHARTFKSFFSIILFCFWRFQYVTLRLLNQDVTGKKGVIKIPNIS